MYRLYGVLYKFASVETVININHIIIETTPRNQIQLRNFFLTKPLKAFYIAIQQTRTKLFSVKLKLSLICYILINSIL